MIEPRPMQVQTFKPLSKMRYIIILRLLTHMMMLTLMLIFPLPLGKVHINACNIHCPILCHLKNSHHLIKPLLPK